MELMQLWFGAQNDVGWLPNNIQANYDIQMECFNVMVSYNITDVSRLCHTWKACICFGLCILILVPFFVQLLLLLFFCCCYFLGR